MKLCRLTLYFGVVVLFFSLVAGLFHHHEKHTLYDENCPVCHFQQTLSSSDLPAAPIVILPVVPLVCLPWVRTILSSHLAHSIHSRDPPSSLM